MSSTVPTHPPSSGSPPTPACLAICLWPQELGDLIKTVDAELALKTYLRATARAKVIECLVQARQLNHVIAYCQNTNYQADWSLLVANIVRVDPEEALAFALKLTTDGVSIDFDAVADAFIQHNCMQQATSFLLEAVKSNRADKALLRARLFEIRSVLQVGGPTTQHGRLVIVLA